MAYFSSAIRRRGRVIPNPVERPPRYRTSEVRGSNRSIVSMGRLVDVKGFDQLLIAYSQVAREHPEWCCIVWGEGDRRGELEALRDELGLRGRFSFPGWTSDPYVAMRQADLFVLSSRYEGFSMVLCEAMACGIPVVSFDCPSGPRHIIRDGIDGVLVPPGDVEALASAMAHLLDNQAEMDRLAARAVDVVERFGLEKVMGLWERALFEILG